MQMPEFVDALCSTADGVFVVDSSQHVLRWNEGAERILGFNEADAVVHPCYQLVSGRIRADKPWCRPDCRVQQCARKHTPMQNFDLLTRSKAGRDLWLNISIISPPDHGQPVSAHVIRDVTKEKRAGEAIEQFLAALGVHAGFKDLQAGGSGPLLASQPAGVDLQKALSGREIEVLTLLAEGFSTGAVAQRLEISHYTARNHIQNILTKLDLHSKAQAVSYAYKKGLL